MSWTAASAVLEIREQSSVQADSALLDHFDSGIWPQVGLRVSQDRSKPGVWSVRAESGVGVATLRATDGRTVPLRVVPKLPETDIFALADYAFGKERDLLIDSRLAAELDVLRPEPAACLLAWYLAELENFVTRWLRRDYLRREQVFNGKIRGRPLINRYVRRHIARGEPHRVPCEYFELTTDNLPNRVLRRTLHEVAQLAAQVALPDAHRVLRTRVERIRPFFAGVQDQRILPGDFLRLNLRGALAHYRPIIEKSRAMLDRIYLSTGVGAHRQKAFMWDMNFLFEDAVRGMLETWSEVDVSSKRGRVVLDAPGGSTAGVTYTKPDYVLTTPAGTAVFDAKYKRTGVAGVSVDDVTVQVSGHSIRVSTRDIYQVIAYGQHVKFRPSQLGLIYPVVLQAGEQLPEPYLIRGFAQPIHVFFVDIGRSAAANVAVFRNKVRARLGGWPTSPVLSGAGTVAVSAAP